MLNINTNYAASFASNAAKSSSQGLNSAMEKLSTGMRINYAKDDAAGQAISTRISAEVQGLQMASRNAADGVPRGRSCSLGRRGRPRRTQRRGLRF